MKFSAVVLLAAVASTANAQAATKNNSTEPVWSECHNKCAESVSKNATLAANCEGVSAWKDNACLCNANYQTQVKNCLYTSGCNTDVPKWFVEAEKICGKIEFPPRGGRKGSSSASGASQSAAAAAASSSPKSDATRNGLAAAALAIPAVVGGFLLL